MLNRVISIISLSGGCKVKALSLGNANIIVKSGNLKATTIIEVSSIAITSDDFLKTSGIRFVKVGNGEAVLLRGFNLGEWLSRALSLMPISKVFVAKSEYICSVGEKLISTIKVYSRKGDISILNSKVDNNNIASVKYISLTGPICSGSDC